jgi:NAD(P)-dependent dehydrogenase (short-subunit alcohol dehydrogenase family)
MKSTILITGASRGIGRALAEVFAANRYHVVGTSRTGLADGTVMPGVEMLPLDLSQPATVQAFAQALQARNLRFDVLVNNAGIGPDLDTDLPQENTLRQTLEVNLTGTLLLTELLLPLLNSNGKIVNVSSKMGSVSLCAGADSVAYWVSKAALNMYTKVLANRLAGQAKVAALHPGWVRTTISPGNVNGRLSAEESAAGVYDFVASNFATGVYWDVETQRALTW